MQGNDIYNAATTPPFAYNPSAGQRVLQPLPTRAGLPATQPTSRSSRRASPTSPQTYKAPAVAQFSLGVQHEIAPSVIWVVQYVGNLAWHQNIQRQINTYPLETDMNIRCRRRRRQQQVQRRHDVCPNGSAPTNLAECRPATAPIQGSGNINQQENTTNGNYNGFQTGLRVQNRWGLSGEVDYTWSHEIDLTTSGPARRQQPLEPEVRQGFRFARSSPHPERQLRLQAADLQEQRGPDASRFSAAGRLPVPSWLRSGVIPTEPGAGPLHQLRLHRPGRRLHQPSEPEWQDQVSETAQQVVRHQSAFSAPIPAWLGGPEPGLRQCRQGLDCRTRPRELHDFAVQVVRDHRAGAFRAPLRVVQHLQPLPAERSEHQPTATASSAKITSAWDPAPGTGRQVHLLNSTPWTYPWPENSGAAGFAGCALFLLLVPVVGHRSCGLTRMKLDLRLHRAQSRAWTGRTQFCLLTGTGRFAAFDLTSENEYKSNPRRSDTIGGKTRNVCAAGKSNYMHSGAGVERSCRRGADAASQGPQSPGGACTSAAGQDRRSRSGLARSTSRPTPPIRNHTRSWRLLEARQEHYKEAVPLYRKALAMNPNVPGLRLNLGLALFKSGDLKGALPEFQKCLKTAPADSPDAQRLTILIGMSHYGLAQYAEAVPFLKDAAANDPQNLHSSPGPGAQLSLVEAVPVRDGRLSRDPHARSGIGRSRHDRRRSPRRDEGQ